MYMAIIGLKKGSGKRSRAREKSGNFDMDNEWQPCIFNTRKLSQSSTSEQRNQYCCLLADATIPMTLSVSETKLLSQRPNVGGLFSFQPG